MKFSQLRTVRSPLRGIFCLSVFSVLFAQLTGLIFANEQQIVIHWTSETTSGSSDLLKDRDGNLLDSGSTSNGDGSIVTLGYFDTATTSDPFNGNWVPLTEGTRIGDSSSGYGYADGTFSFTTIFTKNSSTVEVYPNEPANYNVNSQVVISDNQPPDGHPICIRFYDRTTKGPSSRYNTVHGPKWLWPKFSSGIPVNLRLKIASGSTPSGSKWQYGDIFERSDARFQAVEQIKAILNVYSSIGGQVTSHSSNPNEYDYDSEVNLTASTDSHYEFTGWVGNGVVDPSSLNTKVIMSEDRNVTATFKLKEYNITIKTNPEGVGSVSGSGTGFNNGTTANISATAPFGYQFSHWTNLDQDGIPTTGLDDNESESTTLTVGTGHILFANFDPLPFNISVNSTLGGNATIVEPTPYYFDQSYTLSASSEYGYTFQSWSSSSGSDNLLSSKTAKISAFTVAGDASFTANFTENNYKLTVTMGQGGGSVSPANPTFYNHSAEVPITAIPLEGYKFDKWTDEKGALLNFKEDNTTAIMANNVEDVSVNAVFVPVKYDIVLNSTTGGQVSIIPTSGPWEHFETYPLSASPQPGYQFTEWTGEAFSVNSLVGSTTTSSNELAVTGDVSLTANFELVDYNVSVTLATEGGTVSGGGTYTINDNPQAQAVAMQGWHFTHWSGDVYALNSNSTLTTSVNLSLHPKDLSVSANFARNGYSIDVETYGAGLVNNQTSLSLTPLFEDSISLIASASAGWEFDRWYGDSFSDPTSNSIVLSVNSDLDLNATFKRKQYDLVIQPTSFGSSNGSGSYAFESNVSVSTLAKTGYTFSGWAGDIDYLADINSSTTSLIIPDQNISLTPTFNPKTYQVTVTSDENGSATGEGNYTFGTVVNIIPTGNVDQSNIHTFAGWVITNEDGEQSLRSDNPLSLVVDGNYSVFAKFEVLDLDRHVLSISSSIAGAGQIYNDLSLRTWNAGTSSLSSTITAFPNPGYSFIGWGNPDNETISPSYKSPTITFTMDQNASLVANFSPISLDTSFRVSGNGSVSNDSNQSLLNITALPDLNNNFSQWNVDKNFTYSITVGTSSIDGSSNVLYVNNKESPTLTLLKGYTYNFDCNTSGHDFYLSTDVNSENYTSEFTDSNLTGSRTSNGTLVFTVPNDFDTNQSLYYCSATSAFMGNKISIIESFSDQSIIPFPNQSSISPKISHDIALHAVFNLNEHNVTISSGTGGNIATGASGTYTYGSVVNLVAAVSDHYTFSHWEGATFSAENNVSTSVTISSDTQINAVFTPVLYPFSLSKNIANAGDVFTSTNSYQFPFGSEVSIQALTNPGYIFSNWSNGETNSSTTVTSDTNTSLTANYERKPSTVTLLVSTLDIDGNSQFAGTGGFISPTTVSGKKVGQSIELSASDNTGFQFHSWLIDNNQTHTSRTLNLDLDENQTISAIFKRLSYQVNLTSTPLVGGSIFADIGSTVQAQNLIVGYGDEVKISALSTEAYQFEKWSGNGLSGIDTSAQDITFTVTENVDINARFIPYGPVELKIVIEPTDSGFAIGEGFFMYNPLHPIFATPNTGYLFDSWEGVGIENSFLNNTSVLLNENKTIKAKFKIDPDYTGGGNPVGPGQHTLTISSFPEDSGTTSGSGVYGTGWVDINATSATGYRFSYWNANGIEDSNSTGTRIFLTASSSITAVFVPITGADLLSGSEALGNSWWYSDWFGPFWHRPGDQWIYHSPLGWMYVIQDQETLGVWFYLEYLSGWQWTKPDVFPYFRTHSEARWSYFNKDKSTQATRLFFIYNAEDSNGKWKQY